MIIAEGLRALGLGMAGVFIVMGIIVLALKVLDFFAKDNSESEE